MLSFYTKVAGVTFNNTGENTESRQRIIRDLTQKGLLNPGQMLRLSLDPRNVYDSNAIRVIGPDNRQLGFLPRDIAKNISSAVRSGKHFSARVAAVTGGTIDAVYGINIQITEETTESNPSILSDETSRNTNSPAKQAKSTQNIDKKEPMSGPVAIPSQTKIKRILCPQCLNFRSANSSVCPYCNTKTSSDSHPQPDITYSKDNNSWFNSYLKDTFKANPNPPKYHSLQESEIPEESAQMKKRNYQKEVEKTKKVDASSDLFYDWDWDNDNDFGPDSIDDCYAEYHEYD